MDSNEKKDKIDWDDPTEEATLSQIESEMEILRDLVSLMEDGAKPLEDSKEKGISLLYEYMGQLFLLHSEVGNLDGMGENLGVAEESFFFSKEKYEELADGLESGQLFAEDCKVRLEEAEENAANTMGELSEELYSAEEAAESEAAAETSIAAEEAVVEAENELAEASSEIGDREELVGYAEAAMELNRDMLSEARDEFETGKDAIVNKLEPLAKKINKLIDEYWGIDPTSIRRTTGKEVWEKFEKQRGKDVPTSYKPDDALEYKTPTTSPSKLQEKATEVKNKLEDLSNKEKETKGLILPDPVLQEEQTMITTLERNLRKLVEIVYKYIPNW